MIRTVSVVILALAFASGCGEPRSDASINADVTSELQADPDLSTASVTASTAEGRVLLTGDVATEEQRDRAEDLANDVEGVREVSNEIRVASASSTHQPPAPAAPQAVPPASDMPPVSEPPPAGAEPPMGEPLPNPPADRS
jgi:hypothetical protein